MADSTSTTASTEISAPPQVVLDVIADLAHYPEWADGVRAVDIQDVAEDGRPLRARFDVASGVVNGWYVIDYVWHDDAVTWSLVESPLLRAMDGSYEITATDSGSTVTYTLHLALAMPLIGALRRKAEQHIVSTALNELAARASEVAA
jgi:ribosome-associated toxin RatA of RatAB toxin-antitoxin module